MYEDVLTCGDVSQLAMVGTHCIGAIGCRLERKADGKARLYILTLGVLARYRNESVGTTPCLPCRNVAAIPLCVAQLLTCNKRPQCCYQLHVGLQ
jgi:hypothetical protein